jgi:hypothetical protein
VARVNDDGFLLQQLAVEPSVAVRATIVQAMHGNDALRQATLTAYHKESREKARQRLPASLKVPESEVMLAKVKLDRCVTALATETDNAKLQALALTAEFDVLRAAAILRLTDPVVLEQVALRADDREVLKVVLAKLAEPAALKRIVAEASDRAMRLAASQKSGEAAWNDIFSAATARDATVQALGDALAAVALFPSVQPEAKAGVQTACLNLIRRGDESRIPEMAELLEGYGDTTLAEDYLNCGHPDLDNAGQNWARRHGYDIGSGNGSSRASWGSRR